MYKKIKELILKIAPKKSLYKYEYTIRYFYYLGYIGNKFQCTVCEKKLSEFISLKHDQICPRCGSIQRNRRLWKLLNEEFLKSNIKILDFSPSRSLFRKMKKGDFIYESTDLSGDFLSDKSYNIEHIDSNDESYDLLICYHILEHVDDDHKAMKELFRVLVNGGFCIIQTPFREGEIYEDKSITTSEEREKHFGQSDHVRVYSVNGLKERLEKVGFNVDIRFFQDDNTFNGFKPNETILVCSKSNLQHTVNSIL